MFESEEQVKSRARRQPIIVAKVQLQEGLGFYLAKTFGDGHFTVWGDPAKLCNCSEIIYPVES